MRVGISAADGMRLPMRALSDSPAIGVREATSCVMRSVDAKELEYNQLAAKLSSMQSVGGLSESASFLVWFLENVYRLDEVEARDAVCDNTLDKGVDGIYVDHNDQEVHFLQAKIRQATNGTIGDVGPKNLIASVQQFDTRAKVQAILDGHADAQLKQILQRGRVAEMIDAG
jgi:hypothetical protein